MGIMLDNINLGGGGQEKMPNLDDTKKLDVKNTFKSTL